MSPRKGAFAYLGERDWKRAPTGVRQIGRKADLDSRRLPSRSEGEGHGWPESIPPFTATAPCCVLHKRAGLAPWTAIAAEAAPTGGSGRGRRATTPAFSHPGDGVMTRRREQGIIAA